MSKEFHQDFDKSKNKGKTALILIQGTGAVRAGQWARACCVNDNFEIGSMLPQVEWALEKGISTLVMNPNHDSAKSMNHHAV